MNAPLWMYRYFGFENNLKCYIIIISLDENNNLLYFTLQLQQLMK